MCGINIPQPLKGLGVIQIFIIIVSYQFLTSGPGSKQRYQASNYSLLPQMRLFVPFSAAPQLVR
jgi:hypothetical protein